MVLDKISNQHIYKSLHPNFTKVFDFINNNDLGTIELGKHIIDADTVFVIVMEYTTQDVLECKAETHKNYIDIQYMIKGEEFVGIKSLEGEIPTTPYNKEGDFMFYTISDLPQLKLQKEHFAIFYPDDIHKTMIEVGSPKTLRKAVFKISLHM